MRRVRILVALLIALAGIMPHAARAGQQPAPHHIGMRDHAPTHDATVCTDRCIGCAVPAAIVPAAARVAELRAVARAAFVATPRASFKSALDPPPPRARA